ncbi:conserved exported protein of unknown function [Candidatus Filomicrobium marinum]|uniref:PepSY domain-containing protein n=2 Tax=Filomicrobium TaxID=119044 RepID=A0A0D6JJA0_9HYPH|nr:MULTISPECIES: hypothetical protein [Filomicrobium]MCV0371435.1 hypothetical protein [Filomicrobium sp.]CFX35770.1 conserved exported protein of unknown function [Candidatus Filomicrobium marinum]CPR21787.1 conserved exported protein of unknown function [Candidatus Filomicrobium marinum]SDP64274.1 hypothetical protein SAMN04488061_3593 [Filomicrobium insigne]
MKRFVVAFAALTLGSSLAFADEKPSDAEAAKIKETISAWGCSGGEYEKESEGTGVFEVDDAKCKDGQYDFKLDKDFKILSVTRD